MLDEIENFVNWIRRRNPNSRTWRDYRYDLAQFITVVGDRSPDDISIQDIDRFVIQQSERGLQPSTINRRLAAITSLYLFISDEDSSLICPILPHRHSLREPSRLPRPVPETDLRKFFAVIQGSRDRAMFLLMLRSGLRIAEVASLLVSDLFLDEFTPRLLVRGKGGKERIVYLSPQTLQALHAYLAERPPFDCEHLFLSYQGKGLSTTAIHKRLMLYRDRAGLDLTAHRLRHTFANDLVSADVPVTTIQKLLGHTWLVTTQNYIAANDKKVQADFYAVCERLESWQ